MNKVLFFLVLFPVFLYGESTLRSLSDVSQIKLDQLKTHKSLLVTFQNECSYCIQQIKDLNCLEKDYEIRLIGVGSSEMKLRKELLKMKVKYPGFYADEAVSKEIGLSQEITPQLILWSRGKAVYFNGYKDCLEYSRLLKGVKNG